MRKSLLALCLVPCLSSIYPRAVIAQQGDTQPDPLNLLSQVAKAYAGAGDHFHIESVEEQVSGGELSHHWDKTYSKVMRGSGNKFRVEMRSELGSFVMDSDGHTEWTYQSDSKLYMQRLVAANGPSFPKYYASGGMLSNIWQIPPSLELETAAYKRATLLPDEDLDLGDGKQIPCYVVYVTSEDRKNISDNTIHSSTTYWIDKKSMVVRKSVQHLRSYFMSGPVRVPNNIDTTTTYPVVDLAVEDPPGAFDFAPPQDAKQVASFDGDSPAAPEQSKPTLAGRMAPAVTLVSTNGKPVSLKSLRERPVLLEFWATWCGACTASMPQLEQLSSQLNGKVTVITVDEDQDQGSAADYLARHNYKWLNYHDDQRRAQKAFGGAASLTIPLTILINAKGKIVYYSAGAQLEDLRAALGRLGRDYAIQGQ